MEDGVRVKLARRHGPRRPASQLLA